MPPDPIGEGILFRWDWELKKLPGIVENVDFFVPVKLNKRKAQQCQSEKTIKYLLFSRFHGGR